MARKSVGLALVLAGGLLAWTSPAAYAQTARDVASPFAGNPTSTPSAGAPIRAADGTAVVCPPSYSPAIIVTVDGLQFCKVVPSDLVDRELCEGIDTIMREPYLKPAIESMQTPVPPEAIVDFNWTHDPDDTDDYVPLLRSWLQSYHNCAQANNQKFIVVSHSWGTVLTFLALGLSANSSTPIPVDLYITSGSPLGVAQAPEPCLIDVPSQLIKDAIEQYTNYWKSRFQCTSSTCFPLATNWYNYWIYEDLISGPVASIPRPQSTPQPNDVPLRLIASSFPECLNRDVLFTPLGHYVDSIGLQTPAPDSASRARAIVAAKIVSVLPKGACEPNDSQAHACHFSGITEPQEDCHLWIGPNDVDWYDFYILQKSTLGSYAQITFANASGDLDLCLYKGNTELCCSRGSSNSEQCSLDDLCTGSYSLKVFGKNGATNPSYCLRIVAPPDTYREGSVVYFENDPGADVNWDDSPPCNGGLCNGIAECGEEASVSIVLCASVPVEGVVATPLGLDDTPSEQSLGFLAAGTCSTVHTSGRIRGCSGELVRSYPVVLEYWRDCFQYRQVLWFDHTFPETVSYRLRVCDSDIVVDRDCTGNGVLDSGDNAKVTLSLENYGAYAIRDVECTVDPTSCAQHPCVGVDNNQIDYHGFGDIGVGECVESSGSIRIEQVCAEFSGDLSCDVLCRFDGRDPNNPYRIEDGFSVTIDPQARLVVAPAEADLGVISLNAPRTVQVEAMNKGTEPLTISSPPEIITRTTDTVQVRPALPWVIPAGGSQIFYVDVTPTTCGRIDPPIQVILHTSGCVRSPGEDRIVISGIVGGPVCMIPSCKVPDLSGVRYPDVSGDWMVYTRSSVMGRDVFAYNMRSGQELQLTSDAAFQSNPRISGPLVAWNDFRDDANNPQVYAFDLNAPQLGAFRVAPGITPLPNERIIGVDGNLVAFARIYELLYDTPTDRFPEEASNLLVYAYQGNGTFVLRYSSGWAPGAGTQNRPSIWADGDLGGGLLVFERFYYLWDGLRWQQTGDQHVEYIDFAAGDTTPHRARDHFAVYYCAFEHSFAFADDDANNDNQIFVWRPGGIEQVTPIGGECEPGESTLACGKCNGTDHVFYNYGSCDRPGIYDLDLTRRVERLLCDVCDPADELRVDGCRVTWRDQLSNYDLHFALLAGAECTGDAACDDSNECTVDECACAFCRHKPACTSNAECSDGVFCNGTEQCVGGCCNPGVPPSCDDGIACTTDSCDSETNACVHAPHDSRCDDGKLCNGAETCVVGVGCVQGTRPSCDDGVDCTVDVCGLVGDECTHTPSDARCSNGQFCNGVEWCDARLDCVPGLPPCDDGIGTNGAEFCGEHGCCSQFDLACDGHVDLGDYRAFVPCFRGRTEPSAPGCNSFDADGSGAIDLVDLRAIFNSFTGP
jgi:beta propeller repeat protein